jgi:hypothetical protein
MASVTTAMPRKNSNKTPVLPILLKHIPKEEMTPALYRAAAAKSLDALAFVDPALCTETEYFEICDTSFKTHWNPTLRHVDHEALTEAHYAELCEQAAKEGQLEGMVNPTARLCRIAVTKKYRALAFVPMELRTEELCRIALEQSATAIAHVPQESRTPELCLYTVSRAPNMLHHLAEQTPELCTIAVTKDPHALALVKEQTPWLCLIAVGKEPDTLALVKEQTPELCLIAVKKEPMAIRHAREQPDDLCWIALKRDYKTIQHIRTPTAAMNDFVIRKKLEAEARERRLQEDAQLFSNLIPLMYKNRSLILEEPMFYYMKTPPMTFRAIQFIPVFLGQLVKLWESDQAFTGQCNCGSAALLYSLRANPYHSEYSVKKLRCLRCGKDFEVKGDFFPPNGDGHCFHTLRLLPKSIKPKGLHSLTLMELENMLESGKDAKEDNSHATEK